MPQQLVIKVDLYFSAGILLSILLHLALLPILFLHQTFTPPAAPVFTVSIEKLRESPKPVQEQQIVSQPKEVQEPTTLPKRFQAEKDTSTAKEMIKRGDRPDAGAKGPRAPVSEPQRPQTKQSRANAQQQQKASSDRPHKLKHLSLDQRSVMQQLASNAQPKPDQVGDINNPTGSTQQATTQPFSRPSGSGALVLGLGGTNDFLPNLPDGDITLLNAKANRFAVFVRRIAAQVFSQIRLEGWDMLASDDIRMIGNFSTVYAKLSLKGEVLDVRLEESSGSTRFDGVLNAAVKKGVSDKNPPKEAALADGNIHFVFKARSWTKTGVGRGGAPFERRWLLLGTGLE